MSLKVTVNNQTTGESKVILLDKGLRYAFGRELRQGDIGFTFEDRYMSRPHFSLCLDDKTIFLTHHSKSQKTKIYRKGEFELISIPGETVSLESGIRIRAGRTDFQIEILKDSSKSTIVSGDSVDVSSASQAKEASKSENFVLNSAVESDEQPDSGDELFEDGGRQSTLLPPGFFDEIPDEEFD